MIKVASYCRVSTDKDDQTNSFEAQQRYFRDYIRQHPDWELYETYADEGITGTSTKKRTQFNRMIADAHEGKFQLIITKEVSRFSRNILDTIRYTRELKALGIGVRFVLDGIDTMSPDAELYLSIMASIAQEESRKTSSRVVWGQTRQMERGIVFGPSMLGYDVKNGSITLNPKGAEIVRIIFQKYALEQVNTSEIAEFLTKEGFCTYKGNERWKPSAIIKILHNEKYVGDLVQKKTYTPDYLTHEKRRNNGAVPKICIHNHHEPIVSREVWDLAQNRLRQNCKKTGKRTGHSNRYIFSGKIRCGECGENFVSRFWYQKDGTKIRRWSCASSVRGGTEGCGVGKLLRDDDAVQMLKTAVQSLTMDTEAIAEEVTALVIQAREQKSADPAVIRREILTLQKKKEAMLDSYISGEITKDEMDSLKQKYQQQLGFLNQKLEQATQDVHNEKDIADQIQNELIHILNGETESEVFLKNMLDSITVFKDRHIELRLKHVDHLFWFEE